MTIRNGDGIEKEVSSKMVIEEVKMPKPEDFPRSVPEENIPEGKKLTKEGLHLVAIMNQIDQKLQWCMENIVSGNRDTRYVEAQLIRQVIRQNKIVLWALGVLVAGFLGAMGKNLFDHIAK